MYDILEQWVNQKWMQYITSHIYIYIYYNNVWGKVNELFKKRYKLS